MNKPQTPPDSSSPSAIRAQFHETPPFDLGPRGERKPFHEATMTMLCLDAAWTSLFPDPPEKQSAPSFVAALFAALMLESEAASEEKSASKEFMSLYATRGPRSVKEQGIDQLELSMLLSCAFCADAARASFEERTNEAWAFVADARYWLGRFQGEMMGHDNHADYKREQAQAAAKARHREHHDMKREAIEYYELHSAEFSSMERAATAMLARFPIGHRALYGWIREHCKVKKGGADA